MSPDHQHTYGVIYVATLGKGAARKTGLIKESLGRHADEAHALREAGPRMKARNGKFRALIHPAHDMHAVASALASMHGLAIFDV